MSDAIHSGFHGRPPVAPAKARAVPGAIDPAITRRIANVLCVHLVLVVLTQKLALPISGEIQIAFAMLLQYGVFGIFMLMGVLRVHLIRSLMLLAFVSFAMIVHAVYNADVGYSPGSLFLLTLILAMYAFVVPMDEENYNRILRTFQTIAAVASVLVFVNWGQQFAGLGLFNLEDYIPDKFQYINYVYMNKLRWDLHWYKPNAIVFLEVSHLSQFIGMALVIELARFRRLKYAALYAVALLSSFGGTGTLLVLASAPILMLMLPRKYIVAVVLAAPLLLVGAAQIGVLDNFTKRATEFTTKKSSGYNRFVLPAETSAMALERDGLGGLLGSGAGSIPAGDPTKGGVNGFAWSPYAKVIYEYGLIGFLMWLPLTLYAIFNRGIPFVISWIVFLQYNFLNGALNVPLHTVYCYVLAAGYVMMPVAKSRPASAKPSVSPAPASPVRRSHSPSRSESRP
ncbi:hypothetical protein ABMA32_04925 [Mesorhizobium sp. VNQ89]|uniref:hypothetical protein n=1 Tax=Mesorhizobium quangtriensis TaxID=3157709 RepID=UPI0032B73789